MKKLIALFLALCLITPPIFFVMYSKDTVKAAEFTPPVDSTDPACKLSTKQALESWRELYAESQFLVHVTGNNAVRALRFYNELPPRSGVMADSIYVFSHPKVKGVQAFADQDGCLRANVFLPDCYYKMMIGKAK